MPSETRTRTLTLQSCRHCGAGAPVDVHFCPQCDRILTLARHGDYFIFFGLPRKLVVDLADLEQRFRSLSRQFHPDYYYNATTGERLASLERASYLNDAYRTLRDPGLRVEYLLEIEGVPLKKRSGSPGGVPAALLEEVFELNEEIDAIREAREAGADVPRLHARLRAARQAIERHVVQQAARLDALIARWDATIDAGAAASNRRAILDALRTLLLEKNYVNNLLAAVDKESGEPV